MTGPDDACNEVLREQGLQMNQDITFLTDGSDTVRAGAAHRRRLSRMDSAEAVKATAHQLARLTYAMPTRGEEYVERDLAATETERRDRQIKHLQRQARHFDLALVPKEQAA